MTPTNFPSRAIFATDCVAFEMTRRYGYYGRRNPARKTPDMKFRQGANLTVLREWLPDLDMRREGMGSPVLCEKDTYLFVVDSGCLTFID